MAEHSPTPWRVERNGEMFEIFGSAGNSLGPFSPTPKPPLVCSVFSMADASLIVEAVNANGAWREERRRLQLEAASAGAAFINADARRTLLERYYCEVYADRDRLRDLVRRLADNLRRYHILGDRDNDLLREAREALGEAAP